MNQLGRQRLPETESGFRPAGSLSNLVFEDAADLAHRLMPEDPVLCFSEEALRDRIKAFIDGFPGELSYAVKANPDEIVLRAAAAAGVSVFDVASVHEIRHVRALAPQARLHYHNPIKSREEIAEAFEEFGCGRFAADDLQEIDKIAAVVGNAPGIEIAVRFRLPRLGGSSAHDFSSKFGATRPEAMELLKAVAMKGYGAVVTFHPGSQCTQPIAYYRHIAAAAKLSRRSSVRLAALNVGGGFPARYRDAEETPPLGAYFDEIREAMKEEFGETPPRVECEPGRGIVAPSMSLLTRVKLVKPKRGEVFMNDGIYGTLMEIYQVRDIVPPVRAIRDGQTLGGATRAYTLYGPTCDPLDKLPVKFELPAELRENDFIEFGSVGAYGAATSTRFNGYGGALRYRVRNVLAA